MITVRLSLLLLHLLLSLCPSSSSSSSSPLSSSIHADSSHHRFFSTRSNRPWRHTRPWRPPLSAASSTSSVGNASLLPGYGDFDASASPPPSSSSSSSSSSCPAPSQTFLLRFLPIYCRGSKATSTAGLVVWLLLLFYLLGTTASDYFACTLERLSQIMRLSPALAGVTLLAVGNGAPDVFSSVAAFVSSDESGSIGFGSVLGGALFITTVVSGTVALVTARACKAGSFKINSLCFIRDTLFLLTSAAILTIILLDGKVYLWEAIMFLCIYVLYAASVWALEMVQKQDIEESTLRYALLAEGKNLLPNWSSHEHYHCQHGEPQAEHFLDKKHDNSAIARLKYHASLIYKYGIEWPLAMPRRLTIPMVEEEQWSRPLTVTSCVLGPLFLGGVWIYQISSSSESIWIVMSVTGGLSVLFGLLAFFSTEDSRPPQHHLWAWLSGGFAMSIVWFYLIAGELVTSLETIGGLLSISPAILGLTVLAWGNCIGDLVADLALACSGRDGIQIAISGCYAGPLFNTVVGLGLSLVMACWKSSPEPLLIENDDNSLFYIIAFLGAGLAWALVMMPVKGMQLSRSFGAGLVLLYCGFLLIGMFYAMGWIG